MNQSNHRIKVDDVSFKYKGTRDYAIKDAALKIAKDDILLVTGPAGAGKTTLCRVINGAIPHFFEGEYEGNVLLNNKSVPSDFGTVGQLSHITGYVGQDASDQLIAPTVEDEIAFALENFGTSPEKTNREIERQLRETGLEKYRDKNPHTLSGGEQQLCLLAAFLASKQEILLLDEPTSNIDPLGSAKVFDLIVEVLNTAEDITPLIVEHKLDMLAPLVDRMAVMDNGQILFKGSPREILKKTEKLNEIGVKVPQMVLLWDELKDFITFKELPITVEEMTQDLKPLLKKKDVKIDSKKIDNKEVDKKSEKTVIKAKNLSHTYSDGTKALKNCSLTIKEGEFLGIVGQNGSGKTTLVKHFNSLLQPTEGEVYVMGEETKDFSTMELANTVGYCFQNPDDQIFKDKVKEELAFGPRNIGLPEEEVEKRVKRAANRLEISEYLDMDPFSLSLGERTRVAVASVIAMEPDILIVDEPTTGQDFLRGDEIMRLVSDLNKKGITCLVITHDMQLCAKWVNRLIVLKEGEILLDGGTREVFSHRELLAETNLQPPPITRLGQKLNKWLPEDVLSVEEMADYIKTIMGEIEK